MSGTLYTRHPCLHAAVREIAPDIKRLALAIHDHPELGSQEKEACRLQLERLKRWKFRIQNPFVHLPTAYKAGIGRGRPAFCIMAEYDALPEIGHACGHNLIAAAALGAGYALSKVLEKERIPGTVVIMGTPAEESHGSKVRMVRAGALRGLDAAVMAHPNWQTIPDNGCTAVHRFSVTYHGRAAHAAAAPEKGLNALDAVMLLFQGVNAWRQQLPESSRVHGIVTGGGAAPNIIPEEASCCFYLRSPDDAVLASMIAFFSDMVKGAALMTGTRAVMTPAEVPYRSRRANPVLNEAYAGYAAMAGLNPVRAAKPGRGSTDFGDVSHVVPGVHVYFGVARKPIAAHSRDMHKAAGSAYGLAQMTRAAEALAHMGYRYLTDAAFREAVAAAFSSSNGSLSGGRPGGLPSAACMARKTLRRSKA